MERESDGQPEVGPGDALGRLLQRRPRATAAGLFAACLVLFHANGRPITQIDTVAAPWAAFEVVLDGSVDLSDIQYLDRFERALVHRPDGRRVSRYPPGSTFVAVPFAAPFVWIYGEPLRPSRMRRFGKGVAAVCCAVAIVLFAFTCRELAPGAVLPATLVLAAGTTVWSVAGQALWSHGPALMWVSLGQFLQFVVWPRARAGSGGRGAAHVAVGAGLAYGLAIFTRPTTAVLALAAVLAPAVIRGLGGWRESGWTALGVAVPLAGLLAYDWIQFGAPFSGGYGAEATRFDTPVWTGLAGLMVAPSRGLLVYSPALALAPAGFLAVQRRTPASPDAARRRALLLGWWAAALATWLLYAKWHAWAGGWCFGPRFLTETLPVWALLFAVAANGRRRWGRLRRAGLSALVAISVGIHALGVFGHGNDWNERNAGADRWFELRDTQIEAHARTVARRIAELLDGG